MLGPELARFFFLKTYNREENVLPEAFFVIVNTVIYMEFSVLSLDRYKLVMKISLVVGKNDGLIVCIYWLMIWKSQWQASEDILVKVSTFSCDYFLSLKWLKD